MQNIALNWLRERRNNGSCYKLGKYDSQIFETELSKDLDFDANVDQ